MIFVEAPTSEAEIAAIAKSVSGWKLINMFEGGKTPLLPVSRLEALGYHLVIIPSDTQRAAIKAMQRVLAAIARDGSAASMRGDMVSFKEREALVDTAAYLDAQQPLCLLSIGPAADLLALIRGRQPLTARRTACSA